MLLIAQMTVGAVALTVAFYAALRDVRERIVPNRLCALLLVLGVPRHLLSAEGHWDWIAAGSTLAVAMLILGVGFVLWRLGGLGGGDVKLLAAAAFFVGPAGVVPLIVGTALAGGVLALACLSSPLLPPVAVLLSRQAFPMAGTASRSLPYGVAIAAGMALAVVPTLPLMIG